MSGAPAIVSSSAATSTLLAGGTTLGKYLIRRFLGQGGMGTVYLAFDTLIEREVAIKLLSPELSSNAESLRRFLGEARSIGRLNHPNVVAIHSIDIWQGQYYLVMELLTGGSVAELAEKRGTLPYQEAAGILAQAARGLAAAHQAGMVHRDIKPANLMVSRDGVVKVVDFGLSRFLHAVPSGPDQATRVGQIVGTPHFIESRTV
jgi:serine/threonine protein kinase